MKIDSAYPAVAVLSKYRSIRKVRTESNGYHEISV